MELKSAQCARCESVHEMSSEILKSGCPVCGSKVLRFGRPKEKTDDALDDQWISEDSPTNIKVIGEGQYEIDLEALMKQEKTTPIVISQVEGKYKLSFPRPIKDKKK
ncbi:MAG: OapC/ArvC family zinc-ribbon domain-containing protein [Candidatus Kariarchaeaceae archaeon]